MTREHSSQRRSACVSRLPQFTLCACVSRLPCCCLTQVVSVLFFVISELAGVEPMYRYSLAWFVALFEATLVQAEKARDLAKRIENLTVHFQYSLYLQVRRLRGCACPPSRRREFV